MGWSTEGCGTMTAQLEINENTIGGKNVGKNLNHMETQHLYNTKLWSKLSHRWTAVTNAELKWVK